MPGTGNYLPNSSNLRANESPKYIRNGVIIPSRQLSTSPDFNNNNLHIRILSHIYYSESSCTSSSSSSEATAAATSHHVSALLCFASYFELNIQCRVLAAPPPPPTVSMSMSLDATTCFILWHRVWHGEVADATAACNSQSDDAGNDFQKSIAYFLGLEWYRNLAELFKTITSAFIKAYCRLIALKHSQSVCCVCCVFAYPVNII